MKAGKLSHEQLQRLVIDHLPAADNRVVKGPGVGLDCAQLTFNDGQIILSTDPITGAVEQIGRLCVHIACNDIAACGIRPQAVLLTLMAPVETTETQIKQIVEQAAAAAAELSVVIAGGHTEITKAVNQVVLVATAVGYTMTDQVINAGGGRSGDTILMTKTCGLEGTAILANEQAKRLSETLSQTEILKARDLIGQISVVPEGTKAVRQTVHAMHDATEGGILGAIWELAEASGLGCLIDIERIPVHPLTAKICKALGLDPYRLIASGSLIIATPEPEAVIRELAGLAIECTAIGELTCRPDRLLTRGGKTIPLTPPEADQLYKVE